MTALVGVDGPK